MYASSKAYLGFELQSSEGKGFYINVSGLLTYPIRSCIVCVTVHELGVSWVIVS